MDFPEARRLLGIDAAATEDELKAAYRTALKVWHPDRTHGDAALASEALGRTQRIIDAYALLRAQSEVTAGFEPPEARRRVRSVRTIHSDWWPAR